jgi:F420-dependent oxidoreductase-like protein
MKIAVHSFSTGATLPEQLQIAIDAERRALDGVWYGQIFGHDAITLAALAGRETGRIEIGTAVAQTHSRHPFSMAIQATTAQVAAGGRFTLGLGPSHGVVIESMLGLAYDKPAKHVREYLSVLQPLLREGRVAFSGDVYRTAGALQIPDARPCSVLVSGLAPLMLDIAGGLSDGTILAWAGAATIETHYIPRIQAAAEAVGRPAPRVILLTAIAVHDDADAARNQAATTFEMYGRLPNYQRVLQREGASAPAELAIVGDESAVESQFRGLAAAGVTDLIAWAFPAGDNPAASLERTWALLEGLSGKV